MFSKIKAMGDQDGDSSKLIEFECGLEKPNVPGS